MQSEWTVQTEDKSCSYKLKVCHFITKSVQRLTGHTSLTYPQENNAHMQVFVHFITDVCVVIFRKPSVNRTIKAKTHLELTVRSVNLTGWLASNHCSSLLAVTPVFGASQLSD